MLKISVVVPSFNQGKYLEETLRSIFDQGYPALEVFVIDGGSTDESVDIIRKYEHRLSGWISEKDKGQSDAINKGFQRATGDIVSWLCSDDLYTPGALNKVNELFSSLPDKTGVLHGDSELFRNGKVVRYDKGYTQLTPERQLAGMCFPQPSSFIRRASLLRAGYVNAALHFGMDYDLFARLILVCDFHYCPFLFSRYRLHEDSKSTTAVSKFLDEWCIVFNSIVEGLSLSEMKKSLTDYGLNTRSDETIRRFYETHTPPQTLDYRKMFYYFLLNVITYDYGSDNFTRVKRIGSLLKKEYPDLLVEEPETLKVIRRSLILPPFFLKIARNIKRSLVHK
jgi:glycosyltransferase involved in cell wall biosynthesis